MKKRVLSLFLALTLCLTLLPTAAFAEGETGGSMSGNTTIGSSESGGEGGGVLVGENEKPGGGFVVPSEQNKTGSDPVAKVGDTEYGTLDEILGEMKPVEITLLGNVEEDLEVYAATTIHMGGFSITGNVNITLTESGESLTLENGTVDGSVKVDGGTFTMTAPEAAEAAITKGLNVISGSAYVSGAKIGVKDTLYFDGDELIISGSEKAVALTEAAEPSSKQLYGSTDVDGDTAEEFSFEGGTYQVNGKVAKKLSNKQVGGPAPVEPASLTLTPKTANVAAGETATFTATYTGTGELNAYIQKNGLDTNFVVSTPTNNGDGTYTITVAISEDTPTGDYTLYVHETKDTSVQAMAKIHVKGKDPVAEVIHPGATGGTKYFSLPAALDAAQDGDTVTLLSDVDLGETYVTINKNITFDLGGKTLSSSKAWLHDGVLLIKNATVTVKNGTVKAAGDGSCAIQAYRSGAIMTLEDVTATVTSDKSSVTVGDFGSAVIKSGDYQGLYVGAKSQVTLEGGTFRPYMDTITNKNVKSIFWKVNETTDATSRDCMELLGDGCVYVDENSTQVRTGGGFNTVVTVQQGTAIDAPVAKIGDVEYASLSKAINAVQNGGTITLLDDLDLGNGAVLQVGSSKKNFTIDLDNHTLSADGACLIMLHNGSQLTLKNGTLDGSRCTSYEGVLYISSNSSPKLTLENVTAKSGSVADFLNDQRSVLLAYVTYGTVEFDGGTYTGGVLLKTDGSAVLKSGTFQKGTNDYSIKTEDSGKQLSNYLDGESLFWKDNAPIDLSSATETADEVTVRPCKHNWENGRCTVCQKVCNHGSADGKSMTAAVCPTCGMKAAAQVDITGSDAKYFLTFSDALVYATQNNGCTLKLLANVTDPVSINTPFIFDLNGHNFNKLSVGARAKIRDSSTTKGTIRELKVFNMTDETVLTVADLLEEGYAFKSSSGNKWYFGVENAITNVTVQPAPIKSVTAEHPTVTVEYGKTSGVTLTATAVLATEGGTVSYQWYKIGGTDFPIQDATENTYQLPADLSAGEHTFYLIATKDGYEKSCEFTVTVKKADLRNAEIAFPYGNVLPVNPVGATGVPTFTVTCNGKEVEKDALIITGDKFDDVGTCTLTVTAAENSNYTGSKSAEWTVRPLKIKLSSRTIEKTYDGTTDLPANAKITFESAENMYAGQTIGLGKGTDYQLLDTSYDSPDAGEEKTVSGIVKLLCKDFVFDDGTEAGTSEKGFTLTGKINKAAAPSMSTLWQELHVFNDLEKTYEIELETLLPKRTQPCEYGTVTYGALSVTFTDTAYKGGDATLTNGVLRLPIKAASSAKSEIGTLTVEVSSTNYQTFTLTLHIIADDKIVLNQEDVTVSATDITYGQTLNDSTLTTTGSMICPRTKAKIPGTFAWTDGTIKPDANNSYEAEWTFTPAAGYEEYAVATGTVTVKVNPAKLTVSVEASSAYYTGEAQIASIIASGQSVDSTPVTFTYSDKADGNYTSGGPTFTDAGTYTVYYKAEAANHEPATGTFTVTIDPLPISLLSVSSISKTYDGTASVTLSTEMLTFFSKAARRSDIKLPILALSFSNARFTMKQADGSYVDSPEVGGGKALSFTMTLESDNYVFEREPEGTKTVKEDISTDDATKFTITKADAPRATIQSAVTVINGLAKTYEMVLTDNLPKLSSPCEYGSVSYSVKGTYLTDGYKDTVKAEIVEENGQYKLKLTVPAVDYDRESSVGTLDIKVVSDNYQDFTLTIGVKAKNKTVPMPDGEISATDITYGQTLADSKITGKMKDGNKEVTGTFAWKDGTIKPNAGSYEAEWTFTPDASNGGIYANATGKVSVKVNPKDIKGATVTLKSDSFEYDGTRKDPKVASVVLDGETLVYGQYNDYGYHYDMASDVGTYNLVVGGNHNYTGSVSVTWSITPKTVTPTIEVASCSYTGDTLTPDVTLTDDIGNTIDPKEYTVSYSNNTNAGTGTVTIKDTAGGNYVLNEASTTFTITKAAAPTLEDIVISHKYTVTTGEKTIGSTMPVDAGALSFTKGTESTTGFVTVSSWAVDAATGKVTYTLSSGTAGDTVTLPVTISSTNYADTVINVVITLTRRDDQAALVITGADAVIYGEKLTLTTTGGSGTGAVTYRVDTDHSIGEATIDPNTGVLTPVKVGSVSVIAAKAGDNDYNDITSAPFVLMIKPATPSGEPNYTKITTSGKTLADAQLTVGTITPAGTISWDAGDTQSVAANTAYNWTFKPTDTVNYNNLTGSITPYTVSHSGGGGGSSHSSRYAITVDKTENGTITVSPKSASKGDTVTITVKPDKGYELDTLKVLDKDGDRVKLTEKNGKYTFVMPASKVIVKGSFAAEAPEQIFFDVPVNAYYYNAVKWAADKGITGGVSPTLFAPDQPCTRAQIVTFLWRAAGSPAPKSTAMAFTDVPAGSYYYDAVLWAIENGVTKGTSDTTFSPNANCSRGQIVTFLWRSQKSPDAAAANPFTDVAADAYYISAVLWAVERNITGGTSATTFSPSANCTRAQIVTFIYRYMK